MFHLKQILTFQNKHLKNVFYETQKKRFKINVY